MKKTKERKQQESIARADRLATGERRRAERAAKEFRKEAELSVHEEEYLRRK